MMAELFAWRQLILKVIVTISLSFIVIQHLEHCLDSWSNLKGLCIEIEDSIVI